MILTNAQIKEIAEELDCGFRCFIHNQTKEILIVPDTLKYPDMDLESWEEEMDKLDDNFLDYFEIRPPESHDSFKIMEEFIATFEDSNPIKQRLIYAIQKARPFRNFKYEIDNSGEYRQQWFDFKDSWLIEWVKKELKRFEVVDK